MPDLVLATLNAKFIHASFGLRYLYANLGELQPRSVLLEFDLQQRPLDIVARLLEHQPRIIGFGVYIWNVQQTSEVLQLLRRLHPEICIILGGPEVSHDTETHPLTALATHVITGEADLEFAHVCRRLLAPPADASNSLPKIIRATLPDLTQIKAPYEHYSDSDLQHRLLYVEASRGCPFSCEFCLSSIDIPVRPFPLEPFLSSMQRLLDRGANQFKFVDRTFNLNLATSQAILQFFLERLRPGLFLHLEMVPDRLPTQLRDLIQQFPPGTLQLEVGIQTFDPATSERISRRQDLERLEDNLRFLRQHTGVHVHADLIAGLPGEDLQTFAAGFDRLHALDPQEIQVGILKRLRGTPIVRHDSEWGMVYSPLPPYEILRTLHLTFEELQGVRRFARHWDLVVNSGNFRDSAPLIWHQSTSAYRAFDTFSQWLANRLGIRHAIALQQLVEAVFDYLTHHHPPRTAAIASSLLSDYQRSGRSDTPPFLRPHLPVQARPASVNRSSALPRRQARHHASLKGGTPATPAPPSPQSKTLTTKPQSHEG